MIGRRVLASSLDVLSHALIALNVRLIQWRDGIDPLPPLDPETVERMRGNIMGTIAGADVKQSGQFEEKRNSEYWRPSACDRWCAAVTAQHNRPLFLTDGTDGKHAHLLHAREVQPS